MTSVSKILTTPTERLGRGKARACALSIALAAATGCAIGEQPPEDEAAVAEQSLTVSDSEQAASPTAAPEQTGGGGAVASASAVWTRFPGAHWCISSGYDIHGYQGVDCIDLDYLTVSGGRKYRMTVELKCGTSAGLQQCISGMAVGYFAMNPVDDSGSGFTSPPAPARCVPSGPVCNTDKTGMFIFRHPTEFTMPTSSCRNFVGVADATRNTGGFTLPDNVQVFPLPLVTPSTRVCGR